MSSAEPQQFVVIFLLILLIPVIAEGAIDAVFRVYRRSVWEAISRAKIEAELGLCGAVPDSEFPRRSIYWPEEPLITVRNLDGYTEADELPTAPANGGTAPVLANGQEFSFGKGLRLLARYFTVSMKARQYPPPPGALLSYHRYGARREREGIFILNLRIFRAIKVLSLFMLAITVVLIFRAPGSVVGVSSGGPEVISHPAQVKRDLSNQESPQLVQPDRETIGRPVEVIEETPAPGNDGG